MDEATKFFPQKLFWYCVTRHIRQKILQDLRSTPIWAVTRLLPFSEKIR